MHSQRDSLGCSPVSWVVRAALPWPRVASGQERGKDSEGTHGDARCWRGCGSQQVSRHSTRARLPNLPASHPHPPRSSAWTICGALLDQQGSGWAAGWQSAHHVSVTILNCPSLETTQRTPQETQPHPTREISLFAVNKGKTHTLAFIKMKNLCASKDSLSQSEKAWERRLANHIPGKGLMIRILRFAVFL